MNSSKPPVAGQETKDFLQISGTPGGCAIRLGTKNNEKPFI